MAVIPKQKASAAEAAPAYNAATSGDQVEASGDTIVIFRNGTGGSITVTMTAVKPCDYGTLHDESIVVPATSDRLVAVGDARYRDSSNRVTFTWTGTLTVAVIEP